MITLYTWGTPNGCKISIMLEECGLPYRVQPIDISRDEQFSPEFEAIDVALDHAPTSGTFMPRCTAGRAPSAANQRCTFG